jgi:hypothetical protein
MTRKKEKEKKKENFAARATKSIGRFQGLPEESTLKNSQYVIIPKQVKPEKKKFTRFNTCTSFSKTNCKKKKSTTHQHRQFF